MLLNFHSNAIWHIVHGLESSKFQEEKKPPECKQMKARSQWLFCA